MTGKADKSTVDILTEADFKDPESRFRVLELALVQTANCVKDTYNQQTEHQKIAEKTHAKLADAIKANAVAIGENTIAISKNNATVKVLNRMIFAVFGAVVLGGLGALADRIWGIF